MKRSNRSIPSKRPRFTLVILLAIAAIALFLLKNSIFDNKKIIGVNPIASQTPAPSPPTSPPAAPPKTAPQASVTAPANGPATPDTHTACQQLSEDLRHIFKDIEDQAYIKAYSLDESVPSTLKKITAKAVDSPPVNSQETTDIVTVLKNSTHFFRILGSKDISLLKEILTDDHTQLEPLFAALYASALGQDCQENAALTIRLPLPKAYEYAAFFLNTLGGQSYLSRRDATARILTKYYSVLILSQANQQSLNIYHLDLAYHLDAVRKEIAKSDFLENQSVYLETLRNIPVRR